MWRLVESIRATETGPTEVVFYIDNDDDASLGAIAGLDASAVVGERIVMSDMWNEAAHVAHGDILMACGDDVVFRTLDWDVQVEAAFAAVRDRIVLVHGDDGYNGGGYATHPFLHRAWVDAVGYLVPPYFSCDWSDRWVWDVAEQIGRITYLPEVITEHRHPVVGLAEWDLTHTERMDRGRRDDVQALYDRLAGERDADAAKLRAVIDSEAQVPSAHGPV